MRHYYWWDYPDSLDIAEGLRSFIKGITWYHFLMAYALLRVFVWRD